MSEDSTGEKLCHPDAPNKKGNVLRTSDPQTRDPRGQHFPDPCFEVPKLHPLIVFGSCFPSRSVASSSLPLPQLISV